MDKDEKKKVIDYIESNKALSIGYEEMSEEEKQEYEEAVFNTIGFKIHAISIYFNELKNNIKSSMK